MEISVIIPVYNLENYINKGLISVENQTFKDFEAIIVNDGSTDNSEKIITAFLDKNHNFRLINTENCGVWSARNLGIKEAVGNYIVFLDGDDYVAPDYLEKLHTAALENGADMAVCSAYNLDEKGNTINVSENVVVQNVTNINDDPSILFTYPAPWGKIFKTTLFEGLCFPECKRYEDIRLIPKLFLKASKVVFLPDKLYYYVARKGSAMNSVSAGENLEIISAFKDLSDYFKENNLYNTYKDEIEFLVIRHIAISALTRTIMSNDSRNREVLAKINSYLNSFATLYKNKYIKTLGSNKKLILFLNRNKLYCITKILMQLKSK